MLQSITAWLFSREAQEPIHPCLNITKREFLALVTTGLVIFRFWPEELKIYRDIIVIICVIYLASVWYDLFASIPSWLLRIAGIHPHSSRTSSEAPPANNRWRDVKKVGIAAIKQWMHQLQRAAIRLLFAILVMTARGIRWVLSFVDPQLRQGRSQKPPRPIAYYGILIRSPPVHMYGPISDIFQAPTVDPEPIPWDTSDTSQIPCMNLSLTFRTHLTFALVEASVWTSSKVTLSQKLMSASCWDISGGIPKRNNQFAWTRDRLGTIIGIKDLGLVEDGTDIIGRCQQYSDVIWREFRSNYMWIWWNDVDYALILASLVIGPRSCAPVQQLLKTFERLRNTELIGPRRDRCTMAAVPSAGIAGLGVLISVASGGILAPVALPMAAAAATGTHAFSSLVRSSISSGELEKQQRRDEACRRLINHYPQLKVILERVSCS